MKQDRREDPKDRYGNGWAEEVGRILRWPHYAYISSISPGTYCASERMGWTAAWNEGLTPREAVDRYCDPTTLHGRLVWARLQADWTLEEANNHYCHLETLETMSWDWIVECAQSKWAPDRVKRIGTDINNLYFERLANMYNVDPGWLKTGRASVSLEPVQAILNRLEPGLRQRVADKLIRHSRPSKSVQAEVAW